MLFINILAQSKEYWSTIKYMSISQYQQEVNKIEKETSALGIEPADKKVSATSDGKLSSVMKYRNYIFIGVGTLIFLYIAKPKYVLKISVDKADPAKHEMVLDYVKFAKCWVGVSLLLAFLHIAFTKMRKPKE